MAYSAVKNAILLAKAEKSAVLSAERAPGGAGPLLVDLYATLGSVSCLGPFNKPMQSSLRNLAATHHTSRPGAFAGGWAETYALHRGMRELRNVDTDVA